MNDLHKAIPPTPDMCRDAVLSAVSTYREEEKTMMNKKYFAALVAAVMALLMCGTAYAISMFSVGDVLENPSEAFNQNLVPIESTRTSHGLTVSVGDAIFDGTNLLASIEVACEEGMQPVYVMTRVTATADGQPLPFSGGLADAATPDPTDLTVMTFGQLYPSTDAAQPAPGKLLYKADTWEDSVTGSVDWTMSLELYTPNWEFADVQYERGGESYLEPALAVYKQGKIGTYYGNVDESWIDVLTIYSGIEFDHSRELLVKTGAFTLADTLTFTFTTSVQEPENLADGTIYQMDGHTVEVVRLTRTAMNLQYELLIRFDECQIPEGMTRKFAEGDVMDKVDYSPENMVFRSGSFELAEDGMTATYVGKHQLISDEPLTELTLVTGGWRRPEPDPDAQRFTIKLGK